MVGHSLTIKLTSVAVLDECAGCGLTQGIFTFGANTSSTVVGAVANFDVCDGGLVLMGSLKRGAPTVVFTAGAFSSVLLHSLPRPDGRTRFHFVMCCEVSRFLFNTHKFQGLENVCGCCLGWFYFSSISIRSTCDSCLEHSHKHTTVLTERYSSLPYKVAFRRFLFSCACQLDL